jgi:segregation and condensation protein B
MEHQYKPIIEALLFIAIEPLIPEEIERVLGISAATVLDVINLLGQEYDESGRGFQIRRMGKGYSIVTRPEYAEYIRELFQPKIQQRLTQAALETLAIIAYKQPLTRGEIEDIRGVKAEKALITLQKRNLIQEMGRKHTIGTPIIYGTTDEFLQYFGLADLSELPDPSEFALFEQNAKMSDGVADEELYEGMEGEFEEAMQGLREDLQNVRLDQNLQEGRGADKELAESLEPVMNPSKKVKKRHTKQVGEEVAQDLYLIPLLNVSED